MELMGWQHLCVFLCLACLLSGTHAKNDTFTVVAYLPEWRYEGANFDTICEHTTHLILFSVEPTARGDISGMDRMPRAEIMKEARAAAKRHGTKLMICFGGNGRSGGFSAMTRNAKARARFVANVVSLCRKHSLHGVDYNWEYPGKLCDSDSSCIAAASCI